MSRLAFLLAGCLMLSAGLGRVFGGVPQPAWVLYGQALDEYGWPCAPGVVLELQLNGRLLATRTVRGTIKPGVNFIFRVPLDSGSGALYVPEAARSGERFTVALVQADSRRIVIPATRLPAIGAPGEVVRLNLSAGTDDDGDGLPDEWEQWIIDRSLDPANTTLTSVRPEDDADGDGVSNADEYRAGTDPTWNRDYFQIDEWAKVTEELYRMRFLAVPGKTYALFAAAMPGAGEAFVWAPFGWASSPDGVASAEEFEAAGYEVTLFIRPETPGQVFRLSVR